MNAFSTALRYSEWSLECVLIPPFAILFAVAALSCTAAAVIQRPWRKHLWKRNYFSIASHTLFFVAAMVIGVHWAVSPGSINRVNGAANFWLGTVSFGSLASCAFWVWRMKGIRWFAASLLSLAEVLVLGAVLVAGMSISGDWL